jgi:hypothetical protein
MSQRCRPHDGRVDCAVSILTVLGSKEAEARIIGCDVHAAQQTIAMLCRENAQVIERTLAHEATTVRDFYAGVPSPVKVGVEAAGSVGGSFELMEELEATCVVGVPIVRKVESRRQSTTVMMRRAVWNY